MSIYTLPYLACIILASFLIYFFVKYSTNPTLKKLAVRLFFATIIWQGGHAVIFSLHAPEFAHAIARFSYLGVIFVAVFCSDFIFYAGTGERSKFLKSLIRLSALFVPFVFFTDLIVAGVHKYRFGLYPAAGPLHLAHMAVAFVALLYTLFVLLRHLRNRHRLTQVHSALVSLSFLACAAFDYIPHWGVETILTGWLFGLIGFGYTLYSSFFQSFADLSILTDTLKKEIEKEKEKSLYLVKVFAHDIKNRLAVGIPTLEICQTHPDLQYIRDAVNNEKEMNRMVLNLINVFSEDKITLRKEPIATAFIAERLHMHWDAAFQSRLIRLSVIILDAEYIFADREYICLVWDNLLSNAFNHTPEHGTMEVDFSTDTDGFTVATFKNSGKTIPPEARNGLFDKYAAQDRHSAYHKGLGLHYSKMIAELHNGSLTYTAQNDMNVFTVKIPPASTINT